MAPRVLPQSAVLVVTVVAVVGAFRAPRPGLAPRPRQAPGPRRRRDARAFSASEITPDAFTEKAWEALQGASQAAQARRGGVVEPEDLLGAILRQDGNGLLTFGVATRAARCRRRPRRVGVRPLPSTGTTHSPCRREAAFKHSSQ